jgi:hypothetical protein
MTTIIIEDENQARLLQRKLDKLNIEVESCFIRFQKLLTGFLK